ncbi:Uncharacterised protein [Mycobacteroides abscessus subsp. abscessus]|nr:Uncharacterised protein [Mycobacteroides abscessus subsp. abscessus]
MIRQAGGKIFFQLCAKIGRTFIEVFLFKNFEVFKRQCAGSRIAAECIDMPEIVVFPASLERFIDLFLHSSG